MMNELETKIEKYLDGVLSSREALEFEKELLNPEVTQAFREAIMLRELLQSAPPDQAPEGLAERIAEALQVQVKQENRSLQQEGRMRFPIVRAVLGGASWIFKGPSLAVESMAGGVIKGQRGFSNIRYALGPLANRASTEPDQSIATAPSFWKRMFRRK